MKKLIMFCAGLFLTSIINAQIEGGQGFLMGGLSYSTSSSENKLADTTISGPSFSDFTLGLGGGYHINDRIAAGLRLGYNHSKVEDEDFTGNEYTTTSSEVIISPFARFYNPCAPNFYFFGQAGLNIGFGGSETKSGSVTVDGPSISEFGVGVSPGFAYFLSESVALEMLWGSIGFNSRTAKTDADPNTGTQESEFKDTSFDFIVNSKLLTLGFCWYFGGSNNME